MKKIFNNLKNGLSNEVKETKKIPSLIKNREYVKAGEQCLDIVKMLSISVIWVIPGGSIISGVALKYMKCLRPSSFQKEG